MEILTASSKDLAYGGEMVKASSTPTDFKTMYINFMSGRNPNSILNSLTGGLLDTYTGIRDGMPSRGAEFINTPPMPNGGGTLADVPALAESGDTASETSTVGSSTAQADAEGQVGSGGQAGVGGQVAIDGQVGVGQGTTPSTPPNQGTDLVNANPNVPAGTVFVNNPNGPHRRLFLGVI